MITTVLYECPAAIEDIVEWHVKMVRAKKLESIEGLDTTAPTFFLRNGEEVRCIPMNFLRDDPSAFESIVETTNKLVLIGAITKEDSSLIVGLIRALYPSNEESCESDS